MTLLNIKEAAAFLRYTNYRSLYNNKRVPRVYDGKRVLFVKEQLEGYLLRTEGGLAEVVAERPKWRVRV